VHWSLETTIQSSTATGNAALGQHPSSMGTPSSNADTEASQAGSSSTRHPQVGSIRQVLSELMVDAVDWADHHRRGLVLGSLLGICSESLQHLQQQRMASQAGTVDWSQCVGHSTGPDYGQKHVDLCRRS
jgi:hypothetical protein